MRHGDFGALRAVAQTWIDNPTEKPEVDPRPLKKALGLTAGQGRIAAALTAGRTVREIAGSERISEATVRWHLKQAFA